VVWSNLLSVMRLTIELVNKKNLEADFNKSICEKCLEITEVLFERISEADDQFHPLFIVPLLLTKSTLDYLHAFLGSNLLQSVENHNILLECYFEAVQSLATRANLHSQSSMPV
jgi:hypothetical protein